MQVSNRVQPPWTDAARCGERRGRQCARFRAWSNSTPTRSSGALPNLEKRGQGRVRPRQEPNWSAPTVLFFFTQIILFVESA